MKGRILTCLFILMWTFNFAQSGCSTNRYIDTIFHQVKVTTKYFGTATPYGLLALPQDLYLDLYEPVGDTLTKRPLIVFQFGGGFTIGWRSEPDIPGFCEYFAKCGYLVASIDYRIGLNPVDTGSTVRAYYRGVQDERSALRFLCDSATPFRFDTSSIFLTGTSAGCFCALANTYTTDADRPVSSYGTFLEPDDLGCMDCSGNSNFGKRIPHIKGIVNQWGAILDTNYITAAENVPVISFHGDQDVLVPYIYGYPFQLPVFPKVYGSVPIHQRLNSLGIKNELHPLVGFGHEPELLAPQLNDTIRNYSRVFLYDLLKPVNPVINGPAQICKGDIAVYTVPAVSGSKYCWQLNAAGQIISDNGNSISVLWTDTGNVSVAVSELNYMQMPTDVEQFTTYVSPRPHANFGYVINELAVQLSNWSANASSYNWSLGDGTNSVDANPAKNYSSGGTYDIVLIADNSVCADTFSTSITVDSCPKASFTYQLNNFNAFYNADATNTSLYYWNFGDGDSVAVNTPNVFHQYQQYGTYVVTLKVENQLGCMAVDTISFSILNTAISNNPINNGLSIKCVAEQCSITVNTPEKISAQLWDVSGKLLQQISFNQSVELNLANLARGLYFLKIDTPDGAVTKKIVKE
ncbi:MAG: PKD domain-containing protein [Chitinophagales bacterium]